MKEEIIRHGEVILYPTSLPKNSELKEESNKYIVAHSETGHHHILETIDKSKFKVYTYKGDTYIEVKSLSDLLHEKTGKDVHTTHKVIPSVYKIIIKKEFDYFAGAIRQVRD